MTKKLDIHYQDTNLNLSYDSLIRQKFILLINTLPGDNRLDSSYGTMIRTLLFKKLDISILTQRIGTELKNKTPIYIPEVQLNKVIVSQTQETTLQILLEYVILKENKPSTQVVEVS